MIARLFILAGMFALLWVFSQQRFAQAPHTNAPTPTQKEQTGRSASNKAPAHVIKVLQFVRENGRAPDGYIGGREFMNREKRLPIKTTDGRKIRYSEWDVRPKKTGSE